MADITIAEFDGRGWLVAGEEYIDDFLANTLEDGITIECISCDSIAAVRALWIQNCGVPEHSTDPWIVHPAIVNRARRRLPEHAVFFAQWSAALDQDACAVIRGAAVAAMLSPAQPVQVVEYIDPEGPRSMAELSHVRAMLIEEALVTEGVAASRIGRVQRKVAEIPGMAQESQRVDIVIIPG
jgi:hypothetical protein